MAILTSPCPVNSQPHSFFTIPSATTTIISTYRHRGNPSSRPPPFSFLSISSHLYNHNQTPTSTATTGKIIGPRIEKSLLQISEAQSEPELWAAACLRVRSFYDFPEQSFGIQDHKMYLAEREFEALKERVAGTRLGFRRVSCINATLPLSLLASISDDLCSFCSVKSDLASDNFTDEGESQVVVGTLDLNQCIKLPDEITGSKPKGIGADFARAYLSNVCVAKELQRKGFGYALIEKSKMVAKDWGISDLYVHVTVDNEPAKNLYKKSGFVYENEEPAWQARFLDRPRRLLLWMGIPVAYEL